MKTIDAGGLSLLTAGWPDKSELRGPIPAAIPASVPRPAAPACAAKTERNITATTLGSSATPSIRTPSGNEIHRQHEIVQHTTGGRLGRIPRRQDGRTRRRPGLWWGTLQMTAVRHSLVSIDKICGETS